MLVMPGAHNLTHSSLLSLNTPIQEKPEVAWKRGLRARRPMRRLGLKTNGCRKKFQDGASKY